MAYGYRGLALELKREMDKSEDFGDVGRRSLLDLVLGTGAVELSFTVQGFAFQVEGSGSWI